MSQVSVESNVSSWISGARLLLLSTTVFCYIIATQKGDIIGISGTPCSANQVSLVLYAAPQFAPCAFLVARLAFLGNRCAFLVARRFLGPLCFLGGETLCWVSAAAVLSWWRDAFLGIRCRCAFLVARRFLGPLCFLGGETCVLG